MNDTLIIGAGPAGLTAAYELSKLGCHATILEAGEQVATAKTLPQQVVEEAFAELDGVALGITLGLVSGLGLFFATAILLLKDSEVIGPNLSLLGY